MPYFDHNATTPLAPAARAAWLRASDEAWANPSSPYRISARVHRLLDGARESIAALVGGSAEQILFTSGATEANNAVIRWVAGLDAGDRPRRALVSATEHPSVLAPARAAFGSALDVCAVDGEGRIDPDALQRSEAAFVGVMAANNETGVLGPIDALSGLARSGRAWVLCDAVQWLGRLPAAALPSGAFLVGSAHKFGGPKGVGFLRVPRAALEAGFRAQLGGEQEGGRRAGTENYPAIASMLAALESAAASIKETEERRRWRSAFIETITRRIPGARVHAAAAPCLWNTVSLRLPAHENTRWVVRLDKLGFEVSTGSACATGSTAPSHVLAAMGLTPEEARRTIRISSGWDTREREWQSLADAIVNVWEQLELDSMGETGGVIRL